MLYEHIETGKNTSNQIGDMVESILEMTSILQENEINKIVEILKTKKVPCKTDDSTLLLGLKLLKP